MFVTLPPDHAERMARARLSLDGLSVGDAFGEMFFDPNLVKAIFEERRVVPKSPWPYTDDTEMALGIMNVLEPHGRIDQEELSAVFVRRYHAKPRRGYGATAHEILKKIGRGMSWKKASSTAFNGEGSMGNGAAMRVAPLGAYFADDLERVAAEAKLSAQVTHYHVDGQAGAMAVAVAAAWAWRMRQNINDYPQGELLEAALDYTPKGSTRDGLEKALELPAETKALEAARILGSGQRVTAPDTVSFSLWCADRCLDDYEEAMWTTVAGLGDRDTTCAIVGGIVALAVGQGGIPSAWLMAREPLEI